jgi:hypothetical protein
MLGFKPVYRGLAEVFFQEAWNLALYRPSGGVSAAGLPWV